VGVKGAKPPGGLGAKPPWESGDKAPLKHLYQANLPAEVLRHAGRKTSGDKGGKVPLKP